MQELGLLDEGHVYPFSRLGLLTHWYDLNYYAAYVSKHNVRHFYIALDCP